MANSDISAYAEVILRLTPKRYYGLRRSDITAYAVEILFAYGKQRYYGKAVAILRLTP